MTTKIKLISGTLPDGDYGAVSADQMRAVATTISDAVSLIDDASYDEAKGFATLSAGSQD